MSNKRFLEGLAKWLKYDFAGDNFFKEVQYITVDDLREIIATDMTKNHKCPICQQQSNTFLCSTCIIVQKNRFNLLNTSKKTAGVFDG
jgi:hypothetical protein